MSDQSATIGVAILGSGNIGTDLMYKLLRSPDGMQLRMFAGIDPHSEGLARARLEGIPTSHAGIAAIVEDRDIHIVFDATSAKAHVRHAKILREEGRIAVDMTPAARGPYVVPPVNLEAHLNASNVNLITCGGQATIPLAFAVQRVTTLRYAEMVSTIASKSAGPGTRQNIDEFTATTAIGLMEVGGAQKGKAIIILNPADPPINMTNTVYAVPAADEVDEGAIRASVRQMEAHVQRYVPGYRLRSDPVFEFRDTPWGRRLVVSIMIQVEGAGDYLPKYAGNLDIMTSSALRVGSLFAEQLRVHGGIQS